MSKVRVIARSKTELELQENAKKNDIVDLTDINNIDLSVLTEAIDTVTDAATKSVIAEQHEQWEKAQRDVQKVAVENAKLAAEKSLQGQLAELQQQLANKDAEIEKSKLAIQQGLQEQITGLQIKLSNKDAEIRQSQLETENKFKDELSKKDLALTKLQADLNVKEQEKELAIKTEQEKAELVRKGLQEQLDQAKDFKAKQSTKEIGESLEQYASNEFNRLRSFAFPKAYFEKDNEVSKTSGSKGDFIFRNYEDGEEFVSIMFDMKNEMDADISKSKKHKNADFFKELDKDRKEKHTEYAVLVSLLEPDDDLYNTGIVEVHDYEKMYVVRPQFFITIIGLLNNAARNSLGYKKELAVIREQNIDITSFEDNLNDFKERFGKNYTSAADHYQKAIEQIDRSIASMEKIKKELTTSENQLRLANDKAQDISIKKLTRGNETMQAKFAALNSGD